MVPALTERQRYWLKHIEASKACSQTIAEYAAEHGVTAQAVYAGKKILVRLMGSDPISDQTLGKTPYQKQIVFVMLRRGSL